MTYGLEVRFDTVKKNKPVGFESARTKVTIATDSGVFVGSDYAQVVDGELKIAFAGLQENQEYMLSAQQFDQNGAALSEPVYHNFSRGTDSPVGESTTYDALVGVSLTYIAG